MYTCAELTDWGAVWIKSHVDCLLDYVQLSSSISLPSPVRPHDFLALTFNALLLLLHMFQSTCNIIFMLLIPFCYFFFVSLLFIRSFTRPSTHLLTYLLCLHEGRCAVYRARQYITIIITAADNHKLFYRLSFFSRTIQHTVKLGGVNLNNVRNQTISQWIKKCIEKYVTNSNISWPVQSVDPHNSFQNRKINELVINNIKRCCSCCWCACVVYRMKTTKRVALITWLLYDVSLQIESCYMFHQINLFAFQIFNIENTHTLTLTSSLIPTGFEWSDKTCCGLNIIFNIYFLFQFQSVVIQ